MSEKLRGSAHNPGEYISLLRTIPDADPRRTMILQSSMRGFRLVFVMMTAVSCSALVVSMGIRKYSMDKSHNTAVVLVRVSRQAGDTEGKESKV
jgi:hypothetical protein